MRVGVVRGGMEVEIWKRAQSEKKDQTIITDGNGVRIMRAGQQITRIDEPVAAANAA